MRIGMISNALSVHTQRWARAYQRRGHHVVLWSIEPNQVADIETGQPTWLRSAKGTVRKALRYACLARGLRRRAAANTVDVFHASYVPTNGAIAAWAGLRPLVLSVWGSDVTSAPGRPKPWPIRKLICYALERANTVCTTSEFLSRQVTQYMPSLRPHITPFGVDIDQFTPVDMPGDHGSRPFTIGVVKTIASMYGQQIVLEALPAIRRAIGDVRLVLIGTDRTDGAIRQQARRLGVEDLIELRGFVPHKTLPSHIRNFDLVVNPSVCEESFGVSVLEASASGVPVVATDVGGVSEVCRHGHTGWLVPPGDTDALAQAVIRLAGNESLRVQMGQAGRQFVKANYAWDHCVDMMLERLRHTTKGQSE